MNAVLQSPETRSLHRLFLAVSARSRDGQSPDTSQQEKIYRALFAGANAPVAGMVRKYLAHCPGFRSYLNSTMEEGDFLNDIFIALICALRDGRYSGESANPFGFTKTIAVRHVRGLGLRARTRQNHQAHAAADADTDLVERVADERQSPALDFDRSRIAGSVDWVAARLSRSDLAILRARHVDGLSHADIARRTGRPSEAAARVGLMRAHRRAESLIREPPGFAEGLQAALARLSA